MSLRGIEFHTEESPQAIVKSSDGSFSLKTNKGTSEGLETVGVELTKNGAIQVDEYSRTSVPSIWAVGDVTDRINLTPVALMEGGALAKTLFLNQPTKPDYRAVPSAVFSQPPIGQVGLSEEQAVKEYGDIDVFTSNFRPLKATVSGLPDRVFMKIIVCAKTDKGFAVAVKAGLTKADFDATVGIHPTAAEELVTMRTPTRKIRSSSQVFASMSRVQLDVGLHLDCHWSLLLPFLGKDRCGDQSCSRSLTWAVEIELHKLAVEGDDSHLCCFGLLFSILLFSLRSEALLF
ncbi:hypothetical protein RJ639_025019 [Escallonia herrerae]|uniref:Glutathione reductase n=1 Tax=Escallonia herrerae TaxID=1293975 RepID=A0AA88S583_9ASTE|nr:hypothetical protein RJ639_025019 [Escallonia herrerae]